MLYEIVDLSTLDSSSEPDDSPRKQAEDVLNIFAPRKEKEATSRHLRNTQENAHNVSSVNGKRRGETLSQGHENQYAGQYGPHGITSATQPALSNGSRPPTKSLSSSQSSSLNRSHESSPWTPQIPAAVNPPSGQPHWKPTSLQPGLPLLSPLPQVSAGASGVNAAIMHAQPSQISQYGVPSSYIPENHSDPAASVQPRGYGPHASIDLRPPMFQHPQSLPYPRNSTILHPNHGTKASVSASATRGGFPNTVDHLVADGTHSALPNEQPKRFKKIKIYHPAASSSHNKVPSIPANLSTKKKPSTSSGPRRGLYTVTTFAEGPFGIPIPPPNLSHKDYDPTCSPQTNFLRTATAAQMVQFAKDIERARPVRKKYVAPHQDEAAPQESSSTPVKQLVEPQALKNQHAGASKHGTPYTAEEDAQLIELREVQKINWSQMPDYFEGRTLGSLQVRYSTKLARRADLPREPFGEQRTVRTKTQILEKETPMFDVSDDHHPAPQRRRGAGKASCDGFVSWADLKKGRQQARLIKFNVSNSLGNAVNNSLGLKMEDETSTALMPRQLRERSHHVHYVTEQILRHRQLGYNGIRSSKHTTRGVPEVLKTNVLDEIGPLRYFKGTSGDVTALAWAPDGRRFAAGSIAISDDRSMQYNRPCNLLLGDHQLGLLKELPEHHIERPIIEKNNDENPNALLSMRETQDPRLFLTVASVQFSPDSNMLYSAGSDRRVRAYDVSQGIFSASQLFSIEHSSPLDLMTVNSSGTLATACHQTTDGCIGVFQSRERLLSLSSSRSDGTNNHPLLPSALKWGVAHQHSNLLLAGFSPDDAEEERDVAGATCLWDIRTEQQLEVRAATPSIFDVAWNPSPSSASTVFAVASARGHLSATKGVRSIIQCFAPNQNRATRVLEWHCPAYDINDVLYCRYDDNLIAAGATDGKIYLWDKRYASNGLAPLHVYSHGTPLSVLDHDRDREVADTGVRFLSWGATASRLYSGSSDGVVKMWNPYCAAEDALLKDVATFTSAVMSGAFNPDYRDLLIGEDQGRITALGVGYEQVTVRSKSLHATDKAETVKSLRLASQPTSSGIKLVKPEGSRSRSKRTSEETISTPLARFELISAPVPSTPRGHDSHETARQMLHSGHVVIKPMGALPIRQAVQGPNYIGSGLKPSLEDLDRAEDQRNTAIEERDALVSQRMSTDDPTNEDEYTKNLAEAETRVAAANENLHDLFARQDAFAELDAKAKAHQHGLCDAEDEQARITALAGHFNDECNLDCGYFPPDTDDGTSHVVDSGRSQARIPWSLRHLPRSPDHSKLTLADLVEKGCTRKCTRCSGPAKPSEGKPLTICTKCENTAKGLTASCRTCRSPIRPHGAELPNGGFCERCSFACFRCGRRAFVSKDAEFVECVHCEIVWRADVLGYEVVKERGRRAVVSSDMQSGRLEKGFLGDFQTRTWDKGVREVSDEESQMQDVEGYHHSQWGTGV